MEAGTIFDVIVFLVGVTFLVRGFIRGLSGEVFSLAGTIGGILLAWRFSSPISSLLARRLDLSPTVILLIVIVILYLIVVVLAALLCKIMKALLRFTQLSFTDRVLGGVAGILKTTVILVFVYFVMLSFAPAFPSSWMNSSLTLNTVDRFWPDIADFINKKGFFFDLPVIEKPDPLLLQGENTSDDIPRGNTQKN
ncbi:MAG: CvpA family protein [Synergistales bacterium]|nr:CvpA family protein [Synergistales bacterium]